jgi:osmotically-inducible protein OsmY
MRTLLVIASLGIVAGCNETSPSKPSSAQTGEVDLPLADSHRATDPAAPLDQPKNPTDEDITASIRKKMLDTKMSPNLQNVRVSTQAGDVKLRGTVKTLEEKEAVEGIARTTFGAKSVDSEIEVE